MAGTDITELINRYGSAISRLCRSYEFNIEQAKELNQDIWANIWKSLKSFKGECSERTWIYRVAHNTAISCIGLLGISLEKLYFKWTKQEPMWANLIYLMLIVAM